MQERLFTAYQIADLLDTTPGEVARWIHTGRLEARSLPGGTMRISEQQLVAFLKQEGVDLEQIMAQAVEGKASAGATAPAGEPQGVYRTVGSAETAASESVVVDRPATGDPPPAAPQLPPPQEVSVRQAPEAEAPIADAQDTPETPQSAPDESVDQTPPVPAAPVEPADTVEDRPASRPASRAKTRRRAKKPKAAPRATPAGEAPASPADQVIQAIVADAVARGAGAIHLQRRGSPGSDERAVEPAPIAPEAPGRRQGGCWES